MDKPADPATPFDEVYQAFLADLTPEALKPSTIPAYLPVEVRLAVVLGHR